MAKVLFVIRKTRSNTGRYILYCRVTAQKITREFSTDEEISHPEKWNQERQLYDLERSREAEFINLLVDKMRYKIKTMCLSVSDITADEIVRQIKEPENKPTPVQLLICDYIKWERENLNLKEDTIRHHVNYLENLWDFEPHAFYVNRMDHSWCDKFKTYLRKEKNCLHKTRASRHIEFFKKALDKAVEQKKIKEHGLIWYKQERDKRKPLIYLNAEEVQLWVSQPVAVTSLHKSQKIFAFQMLVGVSFMDIWGVYEVQEIQEAGKILIGRRGKTGECFFLPYHPVAEEILKHFNYKLPRIDNSTYNKEIKLIAALLGINKKLTTHAARRTFIMKHKNEGWDMFTVQEMVGHRTYRTTQKYYTEPSMERLVHEMIKKKAENETSQLHGHLF